MKGITNEELKRLNPNLDDEKLNKIDEATRIELKMRLNSSWVFKSMIPTFLGMIIIYINSSLFHYKGLSIFLGIVCPIITIFLIRRNAKKLVKVMKTLDEVTK